MINISAERFGELLDAQARLAEVEAERDEHRSERHRLMKLISVRESAWEAAEARLAAVETLCDDAGEFDTRRDFVKHVRAAACGEAS